MLTLQMTKHKDIASNDYRQIIAELDEASTKYEQDKKADEALFHSYFPVLYEKASYLATLVDKCKKVDSDKSIVAGELLDEIQSKIDDLRIYIYSLGSTRRVFDCWLIKIIPMLRDLEKNLNKCKCSLKTDNLLAIHFMQTELFFKTPI